MHSQEPQNKPNASQTNKEQPQDEWSSLFYLIDTESVSSCE